MGAYYTRQELLLETRIRDVDKVIDLMINSLQSKEYKINEQNTTLTKAIDEMSMVMTKCHASIGNGMSASDKAVVDKLKRKNEELVELLNDAACFLRMYSYDVTKRVDHFNIRNGTITSLYRRITHSLQSQQQNPFLPSQWTADDTLLLLQRLLKKELLIQQMHDQSSLSLSTIEESTLEQEGSTSLNSSLLSTTSYNKRTRLHSRVNPVPLTRSRLQGIVPMVPLRT